MSEVLDLEIRTLQSIFWSERDPDGLAFAPLADAFLKKGEVREAFDLVSDGTSRLPDFATGHVVAARLYHSQGLTAEAELAARRTLELDPGNVVALATLSDILGDVDAGEEAASIRSALVEVDPDSDEARAVAHLVPSADDDAGFDDAYPAEAATVERLPAIGAEISDPGLDAADLDALLPDEPTEFSGLADVSDAVVPESSPVEGLEHEFSEFEAMADAEPVERHVPTSEPVDFDALAPEAEQEFTDLAALAPDEPALDEVMDLGALAPDEPALDEVVDLGALAPDEPMFDDIMDLDALAPDEDTLEMAALAPDVPAGGDVVDLDALAPDEAIEMSALAPTEPMFDDIMDLDALAPDEPTFDLSELAPDAPVDIVELGSLAPDEPAADEVVELGALAPDPEPVDLAALAPDLPMGDAEGAPPETEPATMANDEPLPTRTLAELYVKQGFTAKALGVYRTLAESEPNAEDLPVRIAELEGGGTPPAAPDPRPSTDAAAPDADDEVEALARDLAQGGEGKDDVDTPFAWSAEEAAEPDRGDIGRYFDSMLDWKKSD